MTRIAVAGNQWITRHLIGELTRAGMKPSLLLNMDASHAPKISGYDDLADLGIPVYRPKLYSLKSPEDEAGLAAHDIDILIVFGWQRLIPEWLLRRCKLGALGVHGGPEKPPRCRGRAVFNWALIMGYERFYMYVFELTPEVDSGDIIELREFDILPSDDVLTLYHKNCIVSSQMFVEAAKQLAAGKATRVKQPHEGETYAPKRTPEMGGIDWNQSAARIEHLVRAVAPPYPGAFTELHGERIFITRAHRFDNHIAFSGTPGEVVATFPNGHFLVQTGDGALYVRDCSAPVARGAVFATVSGEQVPDPVL